MNPSILPVSSAAALSSFADSHTPSSSASSGGSALTTPASVNFALGSVGGGGSSSSTGSNYDFMDRPPSVPSTFLPSYYPDSRDRLPLLPSQQQAQTQQQARSSGGTGLRLAGSRTSSHNPAAVDRISASGPSTRTLLDGVALNSLPRPARPSTNTPTYDLSPSAYTHPLPLPGSIHPWVPKRKAEWNEMPFSEPFYDFGSGGGGGGAGGSGNAGPSSAVREDPPSHAPFSSYPHSHSQSQSPSTFHSDLSGHAPSAAHTSIHANGFAGNPAARSYSNPTSTSTPNPGGGGLGGVPNPLVDPAPHSVGYPAMLYGQVPLPESALAPLPPWTGDVTKVTGEDYAKVGRAEDGTSSTLTSGFGHI